MNNLRGLIGYQAARLVPNQPPQRKVGERGRGGQGGGSARATSGGTQGGAKANIRKALLILPNSKRISQGLEYRRIDVIEV
jgi:hypothetical protein